MFDTRKTSPKGCSITEKEFDWGNSDGVGPEQPGGTYVRDDYPDDPEQYKRTEK